MTCLHDSRELQTWICIFPRLNPTPTASWTRGWLFTSSPRFGEADSTSQSFYEMPTRSETHSRRRVGTFAGTRKSISTLFSHILYPVLSTLLFTIITATASRLSFTSASLETAQIDATTALEILSVLLGVLETCTTLALDLVFELLQWKFTAGFGIRAIRLLALSPTTGTGGALKIAYTCQALDRIKGFLSTLVSPCVDLSRTKVEEPLPDTIVTISDRIWAILRCEKSDG
jgi:hypothetical protein